MTTFSTIWLQKIDKIWANRVQKEIDGLTRSPPPGCQLDPRTVFNAASGIGCVAVRCTLDPSSPADDGAPNKTFVMSINLSLASR